MKPRIVTRYSVSFKHQVVSDLESGRFVSIKEAQQHYGITGHHTVQSWLRKYGKNHLVPKVVRVQKPDEKDQIRELKKQVAELQRALGQTQAESVINRAFFELACEEFGQDAETFKKKADIARCIGPKKNLSNQ